MFFEDKLIFFPEAYPIGDWQPTLPVGVTCDDIYFESQGHELHGWFIKPQHRLFDGVVLHCHGNAGNITTRFTKSAAIAGLGLPVFIFDYRSYGRSEAGRLSEEGVYADAEAAWNFLIGQGFEESEIIVQGVSLGGGPAGDL
ncbi:MAG: alpha/beta hydrolase, partial [Lentisphaeraceae bacterium]|nr:alpha/beta hydrolase [Lentisphaeraceae bacterium]